MQNLMILEEFKRFINNLKFMKGMFRNRRGEKPTEEGGTLLIVLITVAVIGTIAILFGKNIIGLFKTTSVSTLENKVQVCIADAKAKLTVDFCQRVDNIEGQGYLTCTSEVIKPFLEQQAVSLECPRDYDSAEKAAVKTCTDFARKNAIKEDTRVNGYLCIQKINCVGIGDFVSLGDKCKSGQVKVTALKDTNGKVCCVNTGSASSTPTSS